MELEGLVFYPEKLGQNRHEETKATPLTRKMNERDLIEERSDNKKQGSHKKGDFKLWRNFSSRSRREKEAHLEFIHTFLHIIINKS